LYTSPNIVRVLKPRDMRWVGNVTNMRGMISAYNILSENMTRRTTWKT